MERKRPGFQIGGLLISSSIITASPRNPVERFGGVWFSCLNYLARKAS